MNETPQTPVTALAVVSGALPTIIAADKNDILGKLAAKFKAHTPDVTTEHGRKAIASLAHSVATSKMDLIRLGKKLTEDWRKQTAAVNAECRAIEERMDALKDEVRAPLTAFENREKDRIRAHEDALMEIVSGASPLDIEGLRGHLAHLRNYPARDWQEYADKAQAALAARIERVEVALADAERREAEAAELARLREAEAERQRLEAKQARIEREARIAAEAAERAQREAEARAERERIAAEEKARVEAEAYARREREAIEVAERAEQRRIAAEQQAERARQAAEAEAQRREQAAREAEQRRMREEQERAEAEAQRRAANQAHRRTINAAAVAALVEAGISEDDGRAVVRAIVEGKIPHISIAY